MQSENQCFDEHIFRLFSLSVLSYVIIRKNRHVKNRDANHCVSTYYMIGMLYSLHCAYISSGQMLHWISPM